MCRVDSTSIIRPSFNQNSQSKKALFPDTLSLGYKDHAVNTEKYVYYHKVQRISEVKTGIGDQSVGGSETSGVESARPGWSVLWCWDVVRMALLLGPS